MIKIAVFASGTGTNFEALVAHLKQSTLPIEISCLVCDHPDAQVVQKAQHDDVLVWTHQLNEFDNKHAYELAILDYLKKQSIDLIVLAGYMRILTSVLLAEYPQSILNIHPALLPAFPGRHGIEDAFAAGVKVTGVTVHYVDEGIDSGQIIAQQAVTIGENEQIETVESKIHQVEHELYFESICQVLRQKGLI